MTAVTDHTGGRGRHPDDTDRRPEGDDRTGDAPRAEHTAHARDAHRPEPGEHAAPWDDGLIARRAAGLPAQAPEASPGTYDSHRTTDLPALPPALPATAPPAPRLTPRPDALTDRQLHQDLAQRLDALRELVGLSRTRLDAKTLAQAGHVLDEAAARRRLSARHTVVAVAGATGSGKSTLFNALAGVPLSETGLRRPTTSAPIACSWTDGAAGLLDRLGIPGRSRRRPLQRPHEEAPLDGLVLVDLPDHDSAAPAHRAQVDRVLALVDAVIWVVDPEKYADAMLHERYLRPMAGHAEVMFVVLNQVDRLPGDAADQVLDDLRRLLDEDGVALGEHGELGATVLPLSALSGEGVPELRAALGRFTAERQAAARRIAADVDAAAESLRPVYGAGRQTGLSEEAREEFADRLADAVGAAAAGQAAERAWSRSANRACGTPWLRLWRWYETQRTLASGLTAADAPGDEEQVTARQRVEHAVRAVGEAAATGLPPAWGQAVREAATRGASGLPEALDEITMESDAALDGGRQAPGAPHGNGGKPPRPGWWPLAVFTQAAMTALQVLGVAWLVAHVTGALPSNWLVPALLVLAGIVGGPCVEWSCRLAARGPARRYGQEAERRLRDAAAACGRARVLDPVAAELLRYREVREQYVRVAGFSTTGR
ncbi:YfjP family GTPase [Streptomyces sp. NPDC046939]|uniref:YfjP family GTPase n=1 Tax=Streptomyces sp. NPDC046939 TaxID=3155376 RepID=UPI0033F6CB98